MLDINDRHQLIQAYIDNTLSAELAASLQKELAEDDALQAEYEAYLALDGALKDMAEVEPPADLAASIMQRIDAEPAFGAAPHKRFSWRIAGSVAAAAALLLAVGVTGILPEAPMVENPELSAVPALETTVAPEPQSSVPAPETAIAPEPQTFVPAAETTIASEPEKTTAPVVEKTTAAEPEKTTASVAEKTTAPELEKTTAPEPEKTTTSEPEKTTASVAEKTTAAEHEKTNAPEPEKTTTSEPEKTTASVAEKTTAVEPEKTTASVAEKTTAVEPETTVVSEPIDETISGVVSMPAPGAETVIIGADMEVTRFSIAEGDAFAPFFDENGILRFYAARDGELALCSALENMPMQMLENCEVQIPTSYAGGDCLMCFSPDGTLFAGNMAGEEPGIWISDNNSSAEAFCISSFGGGCVLAWSPNSGKLAFSDSEGRLYVAYVMEEMVIKLCDAPVYSAVWNASSHALAFDMLDAASGRHMICLAELP